MFSFCWFLFFCFFHHVQTAKYIAILRDFPQQHPDFQMYTNSVETTGLVQSELGPDQKPILMPTYSLITSPQTYDEWYRDVPGINHRYILELEFKPIFPGSDILEFRLPNASTGIAQFFPVNGLGWGRDTITDKPADGLILDGEKTAFNYFFTMEIQNEFFYRGGEQFFFSGDDDVWVFINNRLAVDLGGVHPKRDGQVSLDDIASQLEITVNNTYPFSFFLAERHTVESNFLIQTTIVPENIPPRALDDAFEGLQDVPISGQLNSFDPDGGPEPLTYSISLLPSNGSIQLNSSSGAFTYTPDLGFFGLDHMIFSTFDGKDYSNNATITFNLLKANTPPVAYDAFYKIKDNEQVADRVRSFDIDGQPLTHSIVSFPQSGTLKFDDPVFLYTPDEIGTFNFTFQASDGDKSSNIATVVIEVERFTPPNFFTPAAIGGIVGGGLLLALLVALLIYLLILRPKFNREWAEITKALENAQISTNPLYESPNTEGINPFYDPSG